MLKEKRLAIIIGVNKYFDPKIPELRGAENDALEIYQRLRDPNIGNFEIQGYLLGKNATCTNLRKAISDAFWKTDFWDLVLFYFSGHGFVDGYNNGYIAPFDMSLDEPYVFGINLRELRDTMSAAINKKSVVMILDCCYSGIAMEGDRPISPINREYFEHHLDLSGEGRIILASSQSDAKSKETECAHAYNTNPHTHGVFTYHLIEGIDGKAADAETGIVSVEGLYRYIEGSMMGDIQQKPKFSVTEGARLKNIQIAVVRDVFSRKIDAIIEEVSELTKRDEIFALYYATKQVNELIMLDPGNKNITNFVKVITDSLQSYSGRIADWLNNNIMIIAPRLSKISDKLYADLYTLEDYLSFDKFVNIDRIQLSRLSALCDVINGRTSPEVLIKRILPPLTESRKAAPERSKIDMPDPFGVDKYD
jgi:hypothetical protein